MDRYLTQYLIFLLQLLNPTMDRFKLLVLINQVEFGLIRVEIDILDDFLFDYDLFWLLDDDFFDDLFLDLPDDFFCYVDWHLYDLFDSSLPCLQSLHYSFLLRLLF